MSEEPYPKPLIETFDKWHQSGKIVSFFVPHKAGKEALRQFLINRYGPTNRIVIV